MAFFYILVHFCTIRIFLCLYGFPVLTTFWIVSATDFFIAGTFAVYSLHASRRLIRDLMQSVSNHWFLRDILLLGRFLFEFPFSISDDCAAVLRRSFRVLLSFTTYSLVWHCCKQACRHCIIYSGSLWESWKAAADLSWFQEYFGGCSAYFAIGLWAFNRSVHIRRHVIGRWYVG